MASGGRAALGFEVDVESIVKRAKMSYRQHLQPAADDEEENTDVLAAATSELLTILREAAADASASQAGWVTLIRSARPTLCSDEPSACVFTQYCIHPEGKSCSKLASVLNLNDPAARARLRRRSTSSCLEAPSADRPWPRSSPLRAGCSWNIRACTAARSTSTYSTTPASLLGARRPCAMSHTLSRWTQMGGVSRRAWCPRQRRWSRRARPKWLIHLNHYPWRARSAPRVASPAARAASAW
jgi:hypothetical protein